MHCFGYNLVLITGISINFDRILYCSYLIAAMHYECDKVVTNHTLKVIHQYLSCLIPHNKTLSKGFEHYFTRLYLKTIWQCNVRLGKLVEWNYSPLIKMEKLSTLCPFLCLSSLLVHIHVNIKFVIYLWFATPILKYNFLDFFWLIHPNLDKRITLSM